jgi:hypothetical protein
MAPEAEEKPIGRLAGLRLLDIGVLVEDQLWTEIARVQQFTGRWMSVV